MYSASRSHRAETRNRSKEELKRVIYSIERVRKWERKWVVLRDTSIRILKWVPVTAQKNITAPTKVAKTVDDETSNTVPSAEDVSQDNTDTQTATVPSRLNFGNTGTEDSNTGYGSEAGFESDSNQTFEPQYKNGHPAGSTDFSAMRREEMNE